MMKRAFLAVMRLGIVGLALLALVMGTLAWLFDRIRRNMLTAERRDQSQAENLWGYPSRAAARALEHAVSEGNLVHEGRTAAAESQYDAQSTRLTETPRIADGGV